MFHEAFTPSLVSAPTEQTPLLSTRPACGRMPGCPNPARRYTGRVQTPLPARWPRCVGSTRGRWAPRASGACTPPPRTSVPRWRWGDVGFRV